MLGEPGIERLRNAGFIVSANDHIVCSKCHAPMAIAGTSWMGGDYLIRLTERT
ncbi:MAG: hypothetical protein ACJ77D_11145 [Chloroflexota bacterium]